MMVNRSFDRKNGKLKFIKKYLQSNQVELSLLN